MVSDKAFNGKDMDVATSGPWALPMESADGTVYAASLGCIKEARDRISEHVQQTPVSSCCQESAVAESKLSPIADDWLTWNQVLTCQTLDKLVGKKLHFKCEMYQRG